MEEGRRQFPSVNIPKNTYFFIGKYSANTNLYLDLILIVRTVYRQTRKRSHVAITPQLDTNYRSLERILFRTLSNFRNKYIFK